MANDGKAADEQDFDVSTMEGIQKFVEHIAEETRRTLFHTHGIMPICTLFALKSPEGHRLEHAKPFIIQPPQQMVHDWKAMRKFARNSYLRCNARGILRIHPEGRRILFQVEHSEFGDLVWYATPDDSYMLGKLRGPVPLAKLEFPKLKVIPSVYMS